MEDVKVVNEEAVETAEETKEVVEETTAAEETVAELKELQLVKGEVVEQQASRPAGKGRNGQEYKAKEARVLFELENGQEGFLLQKDAGVEDEEDLFFNYEIGTKAELIVKKVYPDGGRVLLSATLLEKRENLKKYQEVIDNHGVITAKVIKSINVGLILDHEGYSCLLPTTQIDPNEDLETIVGKEISVSPIRVDFNRIRLIVSQKVANAIKEREEKEKFISTVKVGDVFEGTVKNIESYGAFVELENGVEGLLHISEIEHNRIVKVEKVLNTGDKVKVKVIKVEDNHIGLSRKALIPNYWKDFVEATEIGQLVKGTVTEINNAGVVVALSDEIQAFLPKSETSWERDANIEKLFTVGQEVELQVMELDLSKKRIILSAKRLTENPWEVLDLHQGDEVKCTVVEVIDKGVKLNIEGASGFLSNKNFGEKTEFTVGEEFTAKVLIFDAAKHKLIVTLRAAAPRTNYTRRNNDNEVKYVDNQEKVSNTLGDFINLDDYK